MVLRVTARSMPGQANMAVIKFQRRMSLPSVSFSVQRMGATGLLQRQISDDTGGSSAASMRGGHIVISLVPRDRVQRGIVHSASVASFSPLSSSSSSSAAVTAADNASNFSGMISQTQALSSGSSFDANELVDGREERRSAPGRVHYFNHMTRNTEWEDPTRPAVECPRPQEDVISTGPAQTLSRSHRADNGPTSPTTSPTTFPATSPLSPPSSASCSCDSSSNSNTTNTSNSNTNTTITTSSSSNSTALSASGSHTSTAIHHFVRQQSSPHGNHGRRAQLQDMVELPDANEQCTRQQGPVNVLHTSTGVSTCHDPIPRQENIENEEPLHQKLKPELVQKIKALRQEIKALQPQTGFCRLEVCREDIFEDSYRQVMKMHSKDLQKRLMVKFHGEEGLDYGGVAREWFYLLSHEMLNPHYALFQYSREDLYTLQISPDSDVNPDHLSYFHFVGRVLGMAVFHGHYLDAGFTVALYKQLLGQHITLNDLHRVDPDLHRSLCWMLENSIKNVIESTFSVEHYSYGKVHEYELKPGGSEIKVTDDNKQEYVKLYVQWRFMRGIEAQFLALLKGFSEIIPQHLLHSFDERELELMMGGLGKIDLDDWKRNTRLRFCGWDSDIVRWFWQAMESFDNEMRARVLQFVTGSSRVPLQGFQALQGSTGAAEPRLFTIHQVETSTDNLPKAHTCFNRLDIPPYESFEKFLSKLTCAVEETCGFAVE